MEATTAQQAAAELLRRQRARASLVEFSQSIEIPGVPLIDVPDDEDDDGKLVNRFEAQQVQYTPVESRVALHHLLLMQALQRTIETPRGRLMVFMPPGSAKSTYASVVAPAWAMHIRELRTSRLQRIATALSGLPKS